MGIDQSTPISVKIRYQISEARLAVLQAIYLLSVPQRIIIVGGIIMLLPMYWIMRLSTYQVLNYTYAKSALEPRLSFSSFLPIQSSNATLLQTRDGGYLAYVTVTNPNQELAVDRGVLEFSAQDASGATVESRKIDFYLLPGQKRKIIVPKFTPDRAPIGSKINITNVHMQKRFEIPTIEIDAPSPVISEILDLSNNQTTSHIINKSPFTLGKVEVVYTFFDKSDKVIGVALRSEFTVRPEEKREFPINTNDLPREEISKVETSVYSNPLKAGNVTSK